MALYNSNVNSLAVKRDITLLSKRVNYHTLTNNAVFPDDKGVYPQVQHYTTKHKSL